MAQMPLYAYAFRKGLIPEAIQKLQIRYDSSFIYQLPLLDDGPSWELYLPYDRRLGSRQPIVIESFDADSSSLPTQTVGSGAFWDHTGHIHWNPSGAHFALLANSFEAYAGNQPWSSSPTSAVMDILALDDFALISLLALDDQALSTSQRALLCITTHTQNTDMQWDGRHTVHTDWGVPPTLNRPAQATLRLRIPPWFGLRFYRTSTTTQEDSQRPPLFSAISTEHSIIVHTRPNTSLHALQLIDLYGRTVYCSNAPSQPIYILDIRHLPAGVYLLVAFLQDGQRQVKRFIVK